jgi:hypothetical protein
MHRHFAIEQVAQDHQPVLIGERRKELRRAFGGTIEQIDIHAHIFFLEHMNI